MDVPLGITFLADMAVAQSSGDVSATRKRTATVAQLADASRQPVMAKIVADPSVLAHDTVPPLIPFTCFPPHQPRPAPLTMSGEAQPRSAPVTLTGETHPTTISKDSMPLFAASFEQKNRTTTALAPHQAVVRRSVSLPNKAGRKALREKQRRTELYKKVVPLAY